MENTRRSSVKISGNIIAGFYFTGAIELLVIAYSAHIL
jgi:hypothetical protein